MKWKTLSALIASAFVLTACNNAAPIVSRNISTAADNFEIMRRIVFYNGITDKVIMVVEGLCSIEKDNKDNQLEVTCKVGEDQYIKNYFGLSDNSLYFVEQLDKTKTGLRYRRVIRPTSIIPDIDIEW